MRKRPPSDIHSTLAVAAALALAACSKSEDAAPQASAKAIAAASATAAASVATDPAPTGAPPPANPSAGSSISSDFEGAITMHLTTTHGAQDVNFLTKGGKMRVEAQAEKGMSATIVVDPQAKKTIMIMDAQKMYLEMPQKDPPVAGDPAKARPQITKTGKHETIAGIDCEDWNVAEANGKHVAACITQGITFVDFTAMGRPGSHSSGSWMDEMKGQQYFPLRVVDTDPTGKAVSTMLVTKIEKKPVDDAMFAPPAGYHTMAGFPGMPGMQK